MESPIPDSNSTQSIEYLGLNIILNDGSVFVVTQKSRAKPEIIAADIINSFFELRGVNQSSSHCINDFIDMFLKEIPNDNLFFVYAILEDWYTSFKK